MYQNVIDGRALSGPAGKLGAHLRPTSWMYGARLGSCIDRGGERGEIGKGTDGDGREKGE